jgi:Divergent InlB B-repeat domain
VGTQLFRAIGQKPDGDADGDGVVNSDEFFDGTNPTNSASLNPRLNLIVSGGGTVSPSPLKLSYTLNESVQLTAMPDADSLFLAWSGAVTNTNSLINVVMDQSKTVTAVFGTTLSNGLSYEGTLFVDTTNTYAFAANAGESFILSVGEITQDNANFYPQFLVYGPNGALIASGTGAAAAYASARATNSGIFKVQFKSFYSNGSGTYRINLAKAPGEFANSPGDEGGTLTNGASYNGTLPMGDLDMWSFTANSGDSLTVEMGEIIQSNANFYPEIFLYGPNGALLASDTGGAAALVSTRATNSGVFTVVVNSYYPDGAGTYRVNLARTPDAIAVSPGDEGGPMVNGISYLGALATGDLDVWNFTATAGETVTLRMGEITQSNANYYPQLFLYGPNGAQLANNVAASDAYLSLRLTNSGTFTVVANSYYNDGEGTYRLTLAKAPGAFAISSGDEGGVLTNGGNHDGVTEVGDEDMWTFTANAKETVILRCGDLTLGAPSYSPWIRLYGPDGAFLANDADAADSFISYQTTNSGIFTVLVGSYYQGYAGSYRLRYVKIPGPFIVRVGDEGGSMNQGTAYDAVTDLGDEDIWTFTAYKGAPIKLVGQKLSGAASFSVWLRLYNYNGALLASAATVPTSTINYTPTNNGPFTLVVGSFNAGNTGTYRLSGTNFSDGLKLLSPSVSGTNLNFAVSGGASNVLFIVSATTNVAQPAPLWTPISTNHFDALGAFTVTNLFDPAKPQQYFRLSVP